MKLQFPNCIRKRWLLHLSYMDDHQTKIAPPDSSSITPQIIQKTLDTNNNTKKIYPFILLLFIILLCIGMLSAIFITKGNHKSFSSKTYESAIPTQSVTQQTTPVEQPIIAVKKTITTIPQITSKTAIFISKQGKFRFTYLTSWKAYALNEITAALTVPNNPKADVCSQDRETMYSCDIKVYPLFYDTEPGAKSHAEQIKDTIAWTAEKVSGPISATNPSPISSTPITQVNFGGLSGFEAPRIVNDPKTGLFTQDNIILQGEKQMYIFTFLGETSPKDFDEGRLLILKSFTEL